MIEVFSNTITPLIADRTETRQKIAKAIALGLPLLANTSLVREGTPIGTHEVTAVRQLIQTIAPVDIDNYRLHEHLQLIAKVVRKIGQRLMQEQASQGLNLNLDELEVLGLLHDVGRFFTHAWLRNELIEKHFLNKLGVRGDIIQKIPCVEVYTKKDPNNQEQINEVFHDLSIEQKILEMADPCGKRKPDGGISTFDEVMQFHQMSRKNYECMTGLKPLYPSQRLLTPCAVDFSEKIYRKIYAFFNSLGVNIEEIQRTIIEEEQKSSIQAVIFDVGDVLVPNPDPAILENITQSFEIDPEIALKAWQEYIPPMQTGKLTEEAFWQKYAAAVHKPLPSNYTTLLTESVCVDINPEMRRMIDQSKQLGLKLGILSNTISAHMRILYNAGVYEGFDTVALSPEIRITKDSDAAFKIVALQLWLPSQACVFIDDREPYVDRANRIGMRGIHFKSPQQLEKALKGMVNTEESLYL